MKGTLLSRLKIFCHYLASYFRGVSEASNLAPSSHALQIAQCWSESVCNEWYFTLETEGFFRHYPSLHCTGVNETSNVALPVDAPETVKILSKSIPNEGCFTLQTETVFRH
jgi:hypothetical protein